MMKNIHGSLLDLSLCGLAAPQFLVSDRCEIGVVLS